MGGPAFHAAFESPPCPCARLYGFVRADSAGAGETARRTPNKALQRKKNITCKAASSPSKPLPLHGALVDFLYIQANHGKGECHCLRLTDPPADHQKFCEGSGK